MSSTWFRLLWSLVTVLLLAALIAVVRLVWVTYPPGSVGASAVVNRTPTMATPATPAITESPTVAPTPQPTVALDALQRVRAGGFAFRPPAGYGVEIDGATVLLAPESATAAGPSFQLSGALSESLSGSASITTDELLSEVADRYAQEHDLTPAKTFSTTVNGLAVSGVEMTGNERSAPQAGRLILMEPAAGQIFILGATAQATSWPSIVRQFDALLESVRFFPPSGAANATPLALLAPADEITPTPIQAASLITTPVADIPAPRATAVTGPWKSYTNANLTNAVTAALNTIWVATDGGVVAWNKNNGSYTKYTTLDGLAANRTTTVVNCPLRGFGTVFGSEAGLQIYDPQGSSWKVLNSSNSGMSFDDVAALHCDAQNRFLVVGYKQHGLDIFDANGGAWRYVGQNDGLQNNLVEALAVVGNQEALWVSSGLGISVLKKDGSSAFYDDANSVLETNQIRRIVVGQAGTIWLGAQDALYEVKGNDWSLFDKRTVLASHFPSGMLNGLAAVDDGTLWIGSSQGEVCHFDPVRVQCRDFFAGEPGMVAGELTSLTIGTDGAIYYTTAGGGVSMYAGGRWRAFAIPNEPLFGNEIHSLAQSEDGNLWVATEQGIQAINPDNDGVVRQFTRDESTLSSATKEVLHPAAEGGIWFGAVGVSYFNGLGWTSYTIAEGLAGSLVQAIATDSQGRTWFGTESGLSIWNGSTFFNLTRENGLPSDNIITLLADADVMWIGAADGGLFRFEKNQLQLFSTENSGLPAGPIYAIAKSGENTLLLGHGSGLARFEKGKITPVPALTGYTVSAIATAADGTIWVGTNGEGLYYFDGQDWTTPPDAVQPPSPQISAILVDEEGSVWVGTRTGGLIRYRPTTPVRENN